MRIALTTYSVKPRGGVVHTIELAEALTAQGADVTIVAMGDPNVGFYRTVDTPVHIVAAPEFGDSLEERVFRWIEAMTDGLTALSDRFDIVHCQDCISARAAARVRDAGAPFCVIRTVHHVDDFTTQALIDCQRKAILEPTRNGGRHITAADTAPEGSFSVINLADSNSTVKPGDMVLCRFNKYLVSTCFALIRQGTPARIEGRAIGADLVALITKWKITSIDTLETRIEAWMLKEVKKALAKEDDQRAARIADRGETVKVLIERARELKMTTIAQLAEMTMSRFDDRVVDKKDMVTLCSVHRSKGLENPRVFILGRGELMGRQMRRQWQSEQEINLIYVAVTRAQEALIEVVGVA